MTQVSKWFDTHIPKGIDGYLTSIYQDVEEETNPDKRAKLKMDFVKLVEQVLCQLPQYQDISGQNIKIVISEVGNENVTRRTTDTPDGICEEPGEVRDT